MARTMSVQTYIDPRMMADLVREFEARNIPHKSSYSEVLFTIIEQAHKQWGCQVFADTETALQALEDRGFSMAQMKHQKKGRRMLRDMNLDALAREGTDIEDSARTRQIQELFSRDNTETDE